MRIVFFFLEFFDQSITVLLDLYKGLPLIFKYLLQEVLMSSHSCLKLSLDHLKFQQFTHFMKLGTWFTSSFVTFESMNFTIVTCTDLSNLWSLRTKYRFRGKVRMQQMLEDLLLMSMHTAKLWLFFFILRTFALLAQTSHLYIKINSELFLNQKKELQNL